jgi:hypothetical protein
LDEFLARHKDDIREIDEEALDRAARNVGQPIGGKSKPKSGTKSKPKQRVKEEPFDRVLIAKVPKAGGRWAQVHFNADIVEKFFQITDRMTQRVYLTHVSQAGGRDDVEVRACIFSERNRNYKIEIGAGRGVGYPEESPILVMREKLLRAYDYMLIMPGDPGYSELNSLSGKLPSVGKGVWRTITDLKNLEDVWPGCPLLTVPQEDVAEL